MHLGRGIRVSTLVIAFCCVPASAGPIVDGSLADWGVTVADNNHSNFTTWKSDLHLLGFQVEDQDDKAGHSFYLGPAYGGQDYDAEMMAVATHGNRYYIALVTGQRPDNGFGYFAPGDIRLETSAGTFGIELGGGKGGVTAGLISGGASGSTYALNSSGETIAYADAPKAQVAGSLWLNPGWIQGVVTPRSPTQMTTMTGGTLVGQADFAFTRNSATSQHAIIELSFERSLLGSATLNGVYWRPSCDNDEMNVMSISPVVPEPSVLLLLTAGGALWFRRRR